MEVYNTLRFKKKIHSDYLQDDIYNLLDKTFIIPTNYTYNVFEVTEEYIARPDLISYDAYGDTMFGDIVCKLNGISNPFELNKGTWLILPSPECIMDFVVNPSNKELESGIDGGDEFVPVTKTKQSKRQANDAIVGDSRFKVDAASGVIIY
jgi:hypothetical protein